jgi:hypothetical protein
MAPLFFALALAQITGAIQGADPALKRVEILRSGMVNDTLDAVVVLGDNRKLGLLLQDRSRPSLVYLIAIESAPPGCYPAVERIGETDVVGSCGSEKYALMPNWKFLFDPRAKSLVKFFTYSPFRFDRILLRSGGAIFPASNGERAVDVEYQPAREPVFRLLEAPLPERKPSAAKPTYVPLPVTTYDQFAAVRPERVKNGYVRAGTHLNDSVGPWEKSDGVIWFGKSFYDGEGETGVGGFGSYDPEAKKLKLYSPPEIADFSVSAMLLRPNEIWMGLASFGEGFNIPGGLLRFDRQTETVEKLDLRDVALAMESIGDRVAVATNTGIAIFENNRLRRYFVDRMGDGRWRVAETN